MSLGHERILSLRNQKLEARFPGNPEFAVHRDDRDRSIHEPGTTVESMTLRKFQLPRPTLLVRCNRLRNYHRFI